MHSIISITCRMGGALLILALGSESAIFSVNVPIANPGFEANVLSPGTTSHTIIGWEVDDFSGTDGNDGVFRPTLASYPSGPPEGLNLAYVNQPANRIGQTLTSTLQADTTYILTVAVGARLDEDFVGYRVQLKAGDVVLAEDNSSQHPAPGSWRTSIVKYTSSASQPELGEPLQIFLLSPGIQANFDDVRLTAAPAGPEPPEGPWLTTSALAGFRVKAQITGNSAIAGIKVEDCIVETLCIQGAAAGRPEVFFKIIGPRPNGFLWVQISRFTPSQVEIWVERIATGQLNYYRLEAVAPDDTNVAGLLDREAFLP